jgi:uncharacterized membrane protein SpoIIM required for sporulation/ABC-type transport system involved in multi-copper enzyme maturation permease subunit
MKPGNYVKAKLLPVFLIARREIRDQLRDWRIVVPIVGLALLFPLSMNFAARQILDLINAYGIVTVGERIIPFLLMIVGFFPISISLGIALESFVGEKERMSLEPLLTTPLSDAQIYLAKMISATAIPLLSSYVGLGTYLAGLAFQQMALPELHLLGLVLVLTFVQAVVMVACAVVVSSQATSVRAANLLASLIIIPMSILIQGESVIMVWGDYRNLWWVVLELALLAGLLARMGLAHFQREELLGREIDTLNVRWAWEVFSSSIRDGAKNPWDWYFHRLPAAVKRLRIPAILVLGMMLAGAVLGFLLIDPYLRSGELSLQTIQQQPRSQIEAIMGQWSGLPEDPVVSIWWQNLRALLVGMGLGTFSLGVLGMLPALATMVMMGGIANLLSQAGVPVSAYLVGMILPHGILELPAVILATAAVLHAGAALAVPNSGKTIGEVWIAGIGEWAKIMLGLVIPLLLLAAMVEAWITPLISSQFFR